MPCPCGSGLGYDACCGPLHRGEGAATAEALMRSRYSAFALGDAAYLDLTWHPRTRPDDLSLDPDVRWRRLRILDVVAGGETDDAGQVEFRAHYRRHGEPDALHERSRFVRGGDGRWYYLDAVTGDVDNST